MAGEFSRRGGIFDLFPPDAEEPVRVELFGDDVDSIRRFNPATQRSSEDEKSVVVLGVAASRDVAPTGGRQAALLVDYLPPESWIVLGETADLHEQGKVFLERVSSVEGLFTVNGLFAQILKRPTVAVSTLPKASLEQTLHLKVESVERFSGHAQRVKQELDEVARRDKVIVACHNNAEIQRLTELFSGTQVGQSGMLRLVPGSVKQGFRLVDAGVLVLGSHELFLREQVAAGEKALPTGVPRRRIESRAIDSFLELNDGDYVVHVAHGIALFRGMKMLDRAVQADGTTSLDFGETRPKAGTAREEHLALEFRDGVMLYVPVSKIDLVQKYVGGQRTNPELSKIGGSSWARKKAKVEEAVNDVAVEMLEVQAARATQTGFAFPTDSDWQREFEETFPYRETPDQASAIAEAKGDLEKPKPDGPPDLRRRRLRQDGSRHPHRLQGRRQRQTGRHISTDDGVGRTALSHVLAAHGRIPVAGRMPLALPHGRATEKDHRRRQRGLG